MGEAAQFQGTHRFRVIRLLGQGGMGVVHLVHDRQLGVELALKTLSRVDPAGLYRFKREFRTVAGLVHPNLVALHELIAEGDAWFLTMEYVDGVDFLVHLLGAQAAIIDASTTTPMISGSHPVSSGPIAEQIPAPLHSVPYLSEAGLRDAFAQLASGLCALHVAGRVHKDVKPSNVVVEKGGRVVLLDFGMVDERPLIGERPQLRTKIFGTPAYMSPEQAAGTFITAASDWYSFGVMLFEALTGHLPFDGTAVDIVATKQSSAAPSPSQFASGVPSDLEALCVELLRIDPARRPEGDDILRRLGRAASQVPLLSMPPFQIDSLVGRSEAIASLGAALRDAVDEHALAVLVEGPSGIGKSAVVQTFVDQLVATDSAVVLRARCYERESVPFKAVDGIVDALSRYLGQLPTEEAVALLPRNIPALAKLFPVLGQLELVAKARSRFESVPDPVEVRRRGFAALKELLAKVSDRAPLVLWLDDVQWSDADSAALLVELLRPPGNGAILLVCCVRSEARQYNPVAQALSSADYKFDLRHIEIAPLERGMARRLAVTLLRSRGLDPSPSQLDAIVDEAEGNPFFLGELVRSVRQSGSWAGDDGSEDHDSGRVVSLERALNTRFDALPSRARGLLDMLAVAGCPLRSQVLISAMEAEGYAGFDVDVLQAKHFARTYSTPQGDMVECQHDRIRQALCASLPDETKRAHFHRLAQAMERVTPEDTETIASFFDGAGIAAEAASYALRAADQAVASLAFERAVGFYERALASGVETGRARHKLLRGLGDALAATGQSPAAARRYMEACVIAPESDRQELERLAATQFLRSGHVEEGTEALRNVLNKLGMRIPATPLHAVGSLIWRRGRLGVRGLEFESRTESEVAPELIARIDTCFAAASGLGLIDFVRGADFQTRHLLLALEAGEPYRVARALCFESGFVAAGGQAGRAEAARLLQTADGISQGIDSPYIRGLVSLGRGMLAWHGGDWRECLELVLESEVVFRESCNGVRWEVATGHIFDAAARYYLGDLVEMGKLSKVRLREAHAVGDLYAASDLQTGVQVLPTLAADDAQGARAVVAQERARWPGRGFNLQHWNQLLADSLIDLYDGEPTRAWQRMSEQWQMLTRSLVFGVQVVRIEGHQMRANCALALAATGHADRSELLKLAEGASRRIAREHVAWALSIGQLIGAAVAYQRGDRPAAIRTLLTAIEGFDAQEMSLFSACARLRLSELGGDDQPADRLGWARAYFAAQGVQRPERFLDVICPGF